MRISLKKIIPVFVLLTLIICFFYGEIYTLTKYVTNKALNVFNTNDINVSLISSGHFIINAEDSPTFSFLIDRDISDLDLNRSAIKLYGTETSISSKENLKEKVDSKVKVLSTILLSDERINIIKESDDTLVTYSFDLKINEGYSVVAFLDVYDNGNNHTFEWIDITTSEDGLVLFINSYAYFIQYFIWYLAIFGSSLKTTVWSTVYNSKTKEPISRAIVRISKDGALYNTFVTGSAGVIHARLDRGRYILQVIHPQFLFPSKLSPKVTDGEYKNLYYGEILYIARDNSPLKINIPLDPKDEKMRNSFIENSASALVSLLEGTSSIAIAIFAIAQIIVWPTYLESWIFAFIGISIIVGKQIMFSIQNIKMGSVVDKDGNPISNVSLHLYEAQWDKEVESNLTDERGNYDFVVPNTEYYIKIEDPSLSIVGADSEGKLILPMERSGNTRYINSKIVVERRS